MRDIIDTTNADTILTIFNARAEAEFKERMADIDRRVREYLDHDWSRDVLRALLAMDTMHRYRMFGNIMYNTDGPTSIAGMEAILSFIGCYVMDDGFCHAIPYVPSADLQEVGLGATRPFYDTEEEANAAYAESLAYDARWLEIVIGEDANGRYLRSPDIVEAIRHNEALHAEDDARYADWDE